MPDWSYRTVFRPLLFRLPPALARSLALRSMGTLARLPLGGALIDFLGHMRPDPRLATSMPGLDLACPLILGPNLDVHLSAPLALSRFGFGAIEVGPVAISASGDPNHIIRDDVTRSLVLPNVPATLSADVASQRLGGLNRSVPVILRIGECLGDQAALIAAKLSAQVDVFSIDLLPQRQEPTAIEAAIRAIAQSANYKPVYVCVAADADPSTVQAALERAVKAGAVGLIVDGRWRNHSQGWLVGGAALTAVIALVRQVRGKAGFDLPIIAGGATEPADAMQLLATGANAVQLDAGLAYSGPGLPKRINEAILFARLADQTLLTTTQDGRGLVHETDNRPSAMAWFWALLLGLAMLLGGTLALGIATTRVVLPYDEEYLGMTAKQLTAEVNPRLLHFMMHDRVTLAGTMLAVGVQYVLLAWWGIRRGYYWAKATVVASASFGFGTFFLFLGFGYFDPFHAFVTAILFQFLLLAFQGRIVPAQPSPLPVLSDDWRWRLAQWGQLLMIIEAISVMTAGATICFIGSTSVFVPEDLEFMQTTAAALQGANPHLVPVVAHDRASFGGMLLSVGIATLLPALWGIRQGETWLWWMFAVSGSIGYLLTLAVHLHVGYTSAMHLAPAIAGLALLWTSLALLHPLLGPPPAEHRARWQSMMKQLPSST